MSNNGEQTESEPDSGMPVLYEQICALWSAMEDLSEERKEGIFYEGALTKLFQDLGISPGSYTPITKRMIAMKCADRVRRGGGGSPSLWQLFHEPTIEAFRESMGKGYVTKERARIEVLETQIQSLSQRLSTLEHQVGTILAERQRRLHEHR